MSGGEWTPYNDPGMEAPGESFEDFAPRSKWPTVIGVISLILSLFAMLCSGMGCFIEPGMRAFIDFLSSPDMQMPSDDLVAMEIQLEFIQKYQSVYIAISIIGFLLAGLLLVSSIGLLRRSAWSSKSCKAWALMKILLSLLNTVFAIFVAFQVAERMTQEIGQQAASQALLQGLIGPVIGMIWAWALPVFILIWFSRRAIRTETERWGTQNHVLI